MKKIVIEDNINSNLKLCECGCGEWIPIINTNNKPARFKHGHHSRGSNHPSWKGGRKYSNHGYVMIWVPDHPLCDHDGYVYEHRLVMEKSIGRYLTKLEEVHHINKIKDDNRIENLMLFSSNSEHKKYELKKDMSNRYCLLCGSNKTYLNKKTNWLIWMCYKDGFICNRCYSKNYYMKNKKYS